MVARDTDTGAATGVFLRRLWTLFEMWRRLVTRWRNALVRVWSRITLAERPRAVRKRRLVSVAAVCAGYAALGVGAAVGIAIAAPGLPRTLAAWAGAQSVIWAVVRWLLMRFLGRGISRDRSVVLQASSLGLVAYAVAATPELRLLAWIVSATTTWLVLVRAGDERREAARTVAIAWGAQAVVVAATWIARNAIFAALLGRG